MLRMVKNDLGLVCTGEGSVLDKWRVVKVAFLVFLLLLPLASAQVFVRGYFRRDGTYVRPHYRSNPDGNFWNNWSTIGNINPYTGEVGTRRTPPSRTSASSAGALRGYYGGAAPSVAGSLSTWTPPAGFEELPLFEEALAGEEVERSTAYCAWLYGGNRQSREACVNAQVRALAAVALPDYSDVPERELGRSAAYCEWLFSDNRASFYDCLNRQVLGLKEAPAEFGGVPAAEADRATSYCEWLFGDNRASYNDCLRRQAEGLRTGPAQQTSDLPAGEWARSQAYCEWLFGDNRASYLDCERRQADGLRAAVPLVVDDLPPEEWARSNAYCEWLFGDNRASAADCKARQAASLRASADLMAAAHAAEDTEYCEWMFGDNRAGYWECLNRR